ncbi:hypothetical protein CFE70_000527 [Pyrenophora teres f. teres 0-1]
MPQFITTAVSGKAILHTRGVPAETSRCDARSRTQARKPHSSAASVSRITVAAPANQAPGPHRLDEVFLTSSQGEAVAARRPVVTPESYRSKAHARQAAAFIYMRHSFGRYEAQDGHDSNVQSAWRAGLNQGRKTARHPSHRTIAADVAVAAALQIVVVADETISSPDHPPPPPQSKQMRGKRPATLGHRSGIIPAWLEHSNPFTRSAPAVGRK